ncbi:DUF185-domain-containing protein [Dendrothele bispora CBS 962.96]|uniref:Protein arginine methyltransferase NDUFAF7 n=1 Tax=Dendrothele bispora (strain CBS 962.96) TaxID=1314807 RepID=A0A4S8MBV5_DENBC|nr:DUF185-domain-containing protein [Dendrothele bispora CBS 962.96]
MQYCLGHPIEGYYMNQRNPIFGPKGDFVTSPEISQLFGEMIAVWLFTQWQGAESPGSVQLVEFGPGKGTLMDDILRTFKRLFATVKANPNVEVHLLENSQSLRDTQREKLSGLGYKLQWHETIESIPKSPTQFTMLIAHEFFDALPIHLLRKTEKGWDETLVGSTELIPDPGSESTSLDTTRRPQLSFVNYGDPTPKSTVLGNSSPRFSDVPVGLGVEVSPEAYRIARKVGELLSRKKGEDDKEGLGGCGLIIDYGRNEVPWLTLRAFKDHKPVPVFNRPGECDITANVDFAYLTEAMQDLGWCIITRYSLVSPTKLTPGSSACLTVSVYPPITQRNFLLAMGLSERIKFFAEQCEKANDEERWKRISDGALRLVDPLGMGGQYMFLGISSNPYTDESGSVIEGSGYPFRMEASGDAATAAAGTDEGVSGQGRGQQQQKENGSVQEQQS